MADLAAATAEQVIAACQAGLAEICEGFSRGLDGQFEATVAEPTTFDAAALPEGFDGPGLLVLLAVGTSAALVLVPEAGGLLPGWYAQPDPTGTSKLSTLAQELGMLVLPEEWMPQDSRASRVDHLGEALSRGGVQSGAALVPLALRSGGDRGATIAVVWPASNRAEIFAADAAAESPTETATESPAAAPPAPQPNPSATATQPRPLRLAELPSFTRSLLRIPVTVTVTLASQKQSIGNIVDLVSGSLIQFDKSCEELLDLEVDGRRIGHGEAIKVGDKFGLRVTSLIVPDEQFKTVRPSR